MKFLQNLLGGLSGRLQQKNLVAPSNTARNHAQESPTRQADIPANIKIYRNHHEITYDAVISKGEGTERKQKQRALVNISAGYADQVCVVRSGEIAIVLVATPLYGAHAKVVINDIRDQLSTHNLIVQVYWCVPRLITEVLHSVPQAIENNTGTADLKKYNTEPNRKFFLEILRAALEEEASDVHVELKDDHGLVRFTVDTELVNWDNGSGGTISKTVAESLIGFSFYFSVDEGSNSASSYSYHDPMDWTITEANFDEYYSVKLRMQSNPKLAEHGPDLVFRILPFGKSDKTLALHEQGYSEDQQEAFKIALITSSGLVLIAGIPNSGKTTAIRAAIESVPNRSAKKFVIVEDPPEYILDFASHASIQAGVNDEDREKKYEATIAGWLRGNPHVISTGEIRDRASGAAALTATEIGCMTFATVHAGSIPSIFSRLTQRNIDLDINALTADKKIKLLVFQTLVPKLCKACKIPLHEMDAESKQQMQIISDNLNVDVSGVYFRRRGKVDCVCKGRGIKGKTTAAEVYAPSVEFLEYVRRGDMLAAMREWQSLSDGRFDSPLMAGKRAVHHAIYKMLQGDLDFDTVRSIDPLPLFSAKQQAPVRAMKVIQANV